MYRINSTTTKSDRVYFVEKKILGLFWYHIKVDYNFSYYNTFTKAEEDLKYYIRNKQKVHAPTYYNDKGVEKR